MQTLRLPVRHGEPGAPLRHAARQLLEPHCPPDAVEDAMVVISELIQNVTQHTTGDGELALTLAPAEVLIEVFDADHTLPHAQPPDDRRIGGRGLLVVGRIARDWGSRGLPDGKVVWARIEVPADDRAEIAA